jgi:serine phosphatase RsbU (regulator of sigma subunit)
VYAALGGQHPLPGLALPDVVRAMAATAVLAASTIPLWSAFVGILYFTRDLMGGASWLGAFWRLMLTSIGLPNLISPFGILVAGVFAQNGIVAFSFTVVGLFLVAYLARKLSFEAESSRQRSRQLDQLERLGEAIINSPPNASQLPGILSEYVPSMFNGRIHIWVNGSQVLLHHPAEWAFDHQAAAAWVEKQLSAQAILARQPLPWDSSQSAQRGTIVAPIHDPESSRAIGGIYLDMRSPIRQMDLASLESAYPAIHTLASQIASALKQAEKYAQTLDYQRMAQELSLAGRIQASFLPNRMPDLPGWQLAVTLLPARATSGDFFDFIALPDGSLGILIADVADKGIGPALYMALSRTLIRTYAIEYQANPGTVFQLANRRILSDARANLFITVFFGVLNPLTGELRYCNAGHNPPFLIGLQSGGSLTMLDKTGIPIGIDADAAWNENSVSIQPGDVLVLYTDGVTEAENEDGDFFDEDYLMEVASLNLGRPAYEIQGAILEEVQAFVGHHPQSDDITLMILQRDFTA